MMKPEIKEAWIAALRSGEYEQGHSALRDKNGGMCCLGVLCDLAAKQGVGVWRDCVLVAEVGDADSEYPPHAIQEWADLPFNNPWVKGVPLSDYNDGTGRINRACTFAEIANLIEAYL